MNSKMKDLRRECRYKAETLPEPLRRFVVLLPGAVEQEVETTDASAGGFGFLAIGEPDLFIVGTRITLYPIGKDQPLHGKIMHISLKGDRIRVGVAILETEAFKCWKDKIVELSQTVKCPEVDPDYIRLGED